MPPCGRGSRPAGKAQAFSLSLAIAIALVASPVAPHAFVARSEPRAGATILEVPPRIRIWFDGPVEPMFLDVRVESADKRRVDRGGGRLDPADRTLVEVPLLPLAPGRYRVFWSVIA